MQFQVKLRTTQSSSIPSDQDKDFSKQLYLPPFSVVKGLTCLEIRRSCPHFSSERGDRIQVGIEGQIPCMLPRSFMIHFTEEFAFLAEYLIS